MKPAVLLKSVNDLTELIKSETATNPINLKFGPLFYEPVARIKNAEVYLL